MKINYKAAFLIILGMFIGNCENQKADDIAKKKTIQGLLIQNLTNTPSAGISCPTTTTFSNLETATTGCTGCHGSSTASGGLNMTNYNSVISFVTSGNPSNSILYQKVTTGSMSANSNSTINAVIYCWIQSGASL